MIGRDSDGWGGRCGEKNVVIDEAVFCRECEERLKDAAREQERIDAGDRSVGICFVVRRAL